MNPGKKRGFLQISFAWLFGIIAGAVILALAIFMVTKISHSGQAQTSAEAQKQISVLLNPLETGVQSGQVSTISMSVPTRIYNICDNASGTFGKQVISVSQESFSKWSQPSQGISAQDRYIFSRNYTEGKEFLLFSKPLNFPFAVANLIYLTPASTKYCFVGASDYLSVDTELSNLNQPNILLESDPSLCPAGSVQICFTDPYGISQCSSANVTVNYAAGTVQKNNEELIFSNDALMYAAIFSDKQIYDCQLKRLMSREAALSKLYQEKAATIQTAGCSVGFVSDLYALQNYASSFSSESDLTGILSLSNKLQQENEISPCPLW